MAGSQADSETAAKVPLGIQPGADFSPALEGLRGLAMLMVFWYHAYGYIMGQERLEISPLLVFTYSGHTALTCFFVLSSFLLSRPFIREAAGGKRVSRSDFYTRRLLRILPIYWVAVVVASVLYGLQFDAPITRGWPYLFFLNSFGTLAQPLPPYSEVWWSLATEAQFYLVLPLVGTMLGSTTGRRLVAVGMIGYAIVYSYTMYIDFVFSPFSLYGRLSAFAMGMVAAWVYERFGAELRERAWGSKWMRAGGADGLLALVLIVFGVLLHEVGLIGYFEAEMTWHYWHVPEAVIWAVIILLVILTPSRAARVLGGRVLSTCGVLSYSLYLVHMGLLLHILEPLGLIGQGITAQSLLAVVGVLAVGFAIATVTYNLIEKPFLVIKARFQR